MPYYFTTMTAVQTIPIMIVKTLLDKHTDKYLMIEEKGKTGSNPHYHIILSSHLKRTDKITQLFKQTFYKNKTTNKRTVITKKVDSVPAFFSYYFCKEIGGLDQVISKGYSQQQLDDMWANRTPSLHRVVLKYNDAPYVMYEKLKTYSWFHPENVFVHGSLHSITFRTLIRDLMKEGYICHHLYKYESDLCIAVNDLYCIDDIDFKPQPNVDVIQPKEDIIEFKF